MKFIQKFNKFCTENPITSILAAFFSMFSVIALIKTDDPWYAVPAFMAWGFILIGTLRTTILMLCTVLIVPVQAEEPRSAISAPIVVGVVVVVGAGAFCVWAIKYCQKHYNKPPKTNDLGEFRLAGDVEVEYAASSLYQDAYCWQDLTGDSGPPSATLTTMHVNVTESSVFLSDIRQVTTDHSVDYQLFKIMLANRGLNFTSGTHYALNGMPANQWDVPVRFADPRGMVPHVIHGDGTVRTIIEYSPDLDRWYPKMTNSTGIMRFQFNDVSDTPCGFWRVRRER